MLASLLVWLSLTPLKNRCVAGTAATATARNTRGSGSVSAQVVYSGENDPQMAPARWMEPVMVRKLDESRTHKRVSIRALEGSNL